MKNIFQMAVNGADDLGRKIYQDSDVETAKLFTAAVSSLCFMGGAAATVPEVGVISLIIGSIAGAQLGQKAYMHYNPDQPKL